jgi:hypothetical protein
MVTGAVRLLFDSVSWRSPEEGNVHLEVTRSLGQDTPFGYYSY